MLSPEQVYLDKAKQIKSFESYNNEQRHKSLDALLCEVLKDLGYYKLVDEYQSTDSMYYS